VDPLNQRLKELDYDQFQRLCFQLLKERHQDAGIRYVAGAAGDEGLDIVLGDLANGPTVWQCKSFAQAVGKSQKQQIRESLRRAVKKVKPRQWILCLSVDMDPKALRWFQKLQKSYLPLGVQVGLFAGSDIVSELIHRGSLRDHFFPGASLDPIELRRIVSRSGELNSDDLAKLASHNVEDLIERLKERDARFNYEIIFSRDLGPATPDPHAPPRPDLVMSISDGTKTINVLARDKAALATSPPSFSFKIVGPGQEKFRTLIKKGLPQTFSSDELTGITTDWTLLAPVMEAKDYKVVIGPSPAMTSRRLQARVSMSAGSESVEYGVVEFALVRAGTEEGELETVSEHLPFSMRMTLPLSTGRAGKFHFTESYAGYDVREVYKFVRAKRLLRSGGEMSVHDLVRDKRLFRAQLDPGVQTEQQRTEEALEETLFADLAQVADRFGLSLKVPEQVLDDDMDSLLLLRTYLAGGTLPADSIEIVLEKNEENSETVPELLAGEKWFRIEIDHHRPPPKLFGLEINTGRCAITAEKSVVEDLAETVKRFRDADIGQGVPINIRPTRPVKLELL